MNIFIVDGALSDLDALEAAVREARPDAQVHAFRCAADALACARETAADAVFLETVLPDGDGLALARALTEIRPRINVIFTTANAGHALAAYSVRPSGYLLKPVHAQDVRNELENLRNPLLPPKRLQLHCFGSFEAYVDGEPLRFSRRRTREILAYLTDRQGAPCTMGTLIAVLWENKPVNASMQSNLRSMIHDLRSTLERAGAGGVIRKSRNEIALNTALVDCDYYDYLRGDPAAAKLCRGEYMSQYSWAEMTTGALSDH